MSNLKEASITQLQPPNAVGNVGAVPSALLLDEEKPKSELRVKYPDFLILPINKIFL